MRNVLVVAPCFSPSSYPPSLRNRIFALHLEKYGWKPIILTIESRYSEEPCDDLYARMVPISLEVIRTKALPYQWTRKIGIGDLGLRSFWHQYQMAEKVCKTRKIDLLFISSPPWYVLLIGTLIKRRLGVPYVIDYIDPWIVPGSGEGGPWTKAYWFQWLARHLEPHVVRQAGAITSVSQGLNECIAKLYPESKDKIYPAIPYGIEPADFDFVKGLTLSNEFFSSSDGFHHFVYAGVIWPGVYQAMEALLAAISQIKDKNPAQYKKMRWHFIGTSYAPNVSPQVLPLARKFGVEEIVTEIVRRVSYPSILCALTQADTVVALGSMDVYYSPSKIFSCLLSSKRVLAV